MTESDRKLFEALSARAERDANHWLQVRSQLRALAEHQTDADVAHLLRHLANKAENAIRGLAPICCSLGALSQDCTTRSALFLAGVDMSLVGADDA
jgi:hypothetical protein